jgi:hypothetical protein
MKQLLDYLTTHPDTKIIFKASGMRLWIDSDASYLSEAKARSRVGGYYYLTTFPSRNPTSDDPSPPLNGAIHIICSIMKNVMASASEAELGGLFFNGQEGCPIRAALEFMGHPQPPTPIKTDNFTACGITNETVKQRKSKAMDMRFYWVRDRQHQGQLFVYWKPGSDNHGDYYTKHFGAPHHRAMRPLYYNVEQENVL